MADRVPPLKQESAEGDLFPTEFDPNEDGPDVRSVFLQNDTSDDANVEITRDASDPDNMTFKDEVQTTAVTLTQLLESGLPVPAQMGEVLFSRSDSSLAFTVELPLTSCDGWLVDDQGIHIVVG